MSHMGEAHYSPRLDEALALVADAFRNYGRKATTTPYLAHLLQVMVTVAEHGGDEEEMIAALLHDYLEDIPGASGWSAPKGWSTSYARPGGLGLFAWADSQMRRVYSLGVR